MFRPSIRRLSFAALLVACAAAAIAQAATPRGDPLLERLSQAAPALDREVLSLATRAVACTRRQPGATAPPSTLSVIDYSRPSTEPRLWVFDLASHALLFEELVAHGRNTGGNVASAFSNRSGSNMSSLGAFRTAESYVGANGYSLRLDGLEPGFNDLARDRAIVIHDRARFVASFPERPRPSIAFVDVAHIAAPQRLHQAGDLSRGHRRDQQMHVVGHQHVGMHAAVLPAGDVAQVLEVADAVDVCEEAGLAVVAALDDVLRDSGQVDAGLAGHDRVLAMSKPEACHLCLSPGVGEPLGQRRESPL